MIATSTNPLVVFETSIKNRITKSDFLKAKLSNHTPQAANSSFQAEMEKVHSTCQQLINAGIHNLKLQISLFELKRLCVSAPISTLVQNHEDLEQLLLDFASNQKHIAGLEARILELTSNPFPAHLPAEWLNQFGTS